MGKRNKVCKNVKGDRNKRQQKPLTGPYTNQIITRVFHAVIPKLKSIRFQKTAYNKSVTEIFDPGLDSLGSLLCAVIGTRSRREGHSIPKLTLCGWQDSRNHIRYCWSTTQDVCSFIRNGENRRMRETNYKLTRSSGSKARSTTMPAKSATTSTETCVSKKWSCEPRMHRRTSRFQLTESSRFITSLNHETNGSTGAGCARRNLARRHAGAWCRRRL